MAMTTRGTMAMERITTTLPPDMIYLLDYHARNNGITRSALNRAIITHYLSKPDLFLPGMLGRARHNNDHGEAEKAA